MELPEVKSANKRKRAAKMDISDIQLPDPKSGAEGESKEETPKRRHRRRAATSASVKTDSSSSTSGVMIR